MAKNALLIVGTIVFLGATHLATLRAGHEWGDDFSLYVAHARNLVEGRPYADTGYIYDPQNPAVSPRSYPPIFPLLLAPVYRLFGMNLLAMKAFVVLIFMAALVTLAVVFRQRLPLPYMLGCLALFALNPYVWQHKDRLLSEAPFMLFAYAALILAEKAQEREGSTSGSIAWGLFAGLVAYLAAGTRTVGVVLLPSILGVELLRRRRLGAASLGIVTAFSAAVLAQKLLLDLDGSYADQLVFDPVRYLRIGLSLVKAMGFFVDNGYSRAAVAVLYACLMALACVGYVTRVRSGVTVYELFAAFNFMVLTLWPEAESDLRFLLPILPLLFLYVGEGLRRLGGTSIGRVEKPLATALSLAILLSYAGKYTRLEVGPVRDGVSTPEAVALFDWIRGQTNSDDVFMFQKPRALALYTRRQAVAHPRIADDGRLRQFLQSTGVTYIVLRESIPINDYQGPKLVQRLIADYAARCEKVYENGGFSIYRIRRESLAFALTNAAEKPCGAGALTAKPAMPSSRRPMGRSTTPPRGPRTRVHPGREERRDRHDQHEAPGPAELAVVAIALLLVATIALYLFVENFAPR
jgi:hypothetical protein